MDAIVQLVIIFLTLSIGVCLGILVKGYDLERMDVGTFTINETDPKKELFAINFEKDLDEFKNKDAIAFRILRK
jgi:hypothetical protein